MTVEHLLLIFGMAVVTYLPRMAPLIFLSGRELPANLMRVLEMVPPAVLAALLAPELFLRGGPDGAKSLFFGLDNQYLLAAVPTVIACRLTGSFFGTVAAGMGSLALLRWLWPLP